MSFSVSERIYTKNMKITIINGPNLNLLGLREPAIYGLDTYSELVKKIEDYCQSLGIKVKIMQTNHEGTIIDMLQNCYGECDGIILNPGGYTHTSIAIGDTLAAIQIPTAEVHISDVDSREDFRKISFIRPHCEITISGHGTDGYIEAIKYFYDKFNKG